MTTINSEPEYVIVARTLDEDVERIELPTEQDSTLGLQTLVGAFPGAHGLKYKNPLTGAFRALLIDPTGTKFYPPADGWSNKVFVVLTHHQQASTESNVSVKSSQMKKSDQNAKRRKLMIESDDADSCDSDAEQIGKSRTDTVSSSFKWQKGASKQKRMMGNKETEAEEEELPNKMVDLLVQGLPFELTEAELRAHFENFGKVVHCEVKSQKGSASNRGYGFVQMGDLDDQRKVLKQKFHTINGRECQVKVPFSKNPLSSKVFVGRIKETVTTLELRNFFNEEARKIDTDSAVTDVYIPRPFRSFAFVTFSSPFVAKELIKKGQMTMFDTMIYVSSAHSTRPHNQQQQDGQGHVNHLQQFIDTHLPRGNNIHHLPPAYQTANDHFSLKNPIQSVQEGNDLFSDFFSNDRNLLEMGMAMGGGTRSALPPGLNINPSRIAGPMFSGPAYQQPQIPHNSNPALPTGCGGTALPVAAGNQMLNQMETLNLNNMGGVDQNTLAKALHAFFSIAQNATASNNNSNNTVLGNGVQRQQPMIGGMAASKQSSATQQQQQQPTITTTSALQQQFPVQSLSPLPHSQQSTSSASTRVYAPVKHSQQFQGGRGRNGSAGAGWR